MSIKKCFEDTIGVIRSRNSTNNTMAMRKRMNNNLQTIQWPWEKEQVIIYKQYNDHEKKNK